MTWVFVPYEEGQKYTSSDLEPAAVFADEDLLAAASKVLRANGFDVVSGRWTAKGEWRCAKRGIVHYFPKASRMSLCGRVKRANTTELAVGLHCSHCSRKRRTRKEDAQPRKESKVG